LKQIYDEFPDLVRDDKTQATLCDLYSKSFFMPEDLTTHVTPTLIDAYQFMFKSLRNN